MECSSLDSSDIFSWLEWNYAFLTQIGWKWCGRLLVHHVKGFVMSMSCCQCYLPGPLGWVGGCRSLCCKIPVSLLWLPWGEMLKVCKCSFASNIPPPIFASLMDLICNGYYCNICLVVILLVPLYLGLLEFYCKEDLFLPHIYFLVF